ncbi:MAG TPA: hypothetical protein DCQ98_07870 [Planctomycetaceae bacterium]|nr:hypothetical protein [Planctomycetaceae bacterium]
MNIDQWKKTRRARAPWTERSTKFSWRFWCEEDMDRVSEQGGDWRESDVLPGGCLRRRRNATVARIDSGKSA